MGALELRAILAANLRRMIDAATPAGARPSVRAWAISKGLDVRLIDRLTKGQHAVTLDKIDEIATACGVPAWQLLVENFDPTSGGNPTIGPEDKAILDKLRRLLG